MTSDLYVIDKKTINEMSHLLDILDKKIIDMLKSQEFKEHISSEKVSKALSEVALKQKAIKSGLVKKESI
jgi:hypothetical protein